MPEISIAQVSEAVGGAVHRQVLVHQEEEQRCILSSLNALKEALKFAVGFPLKTEVRRGVERAVNLLEKGISCRKKWQKMETPASSTSQGASTPTSTPVQWPQTVMSASLKRQKMSPESPETEGEWSTATNSRKKKKKAGEVVVGTPLTTSEKKNVGKSDTSGRPAISNMKTLRTRMQRSAIIIKPQEKSTFAEVLRELRNTVNPGEMGADVRTIRKTRDGDVLIELGRQSANQKEFADKIKAVLGDRGTTRSLVPRVSLEVRDLDDVTTVEDVRAALERDLKPEDTNEMEIFLTKPNVRGQQSAVVKMVEKTALQLLERGRIRIGWVNCRVRQRAEVDRCFRCLGYGHRAPSCKGPDRSRLCYQCGEEGHTKKDCKSTPKCVLCAKLGMPLDRTAHLPGSGGCKAFREALEGAKSRLR
ncbi:ZnF_C2HC [Nesidiocoris tenuis]|uniref:ZnF_C2HC n=1 Tax=Nesidiocoris tenuis TaxID=355587 RepID=A0ABN7AH75_9HEMI|nr:ZnF_C2HC [Nesidiocoris tenuis]